MTTLIAYKMHPAVTKTAFVDLMEGHREADRIVQGTYWENGRGCAVGCGLHSVRALTGLALSHSDHAALAAQVGVPEVLERLQDRIFEGLPRELAREWPLRFAGAIPDGADLAAVWPKFAVALLRNLPPTPGYPDVTAAVARVATGWETGWADDDPRAAWSAAWSAASAAWSAARSAASAAESAAWSAASAAESAARSAASAAESAARSAAYVWMAATLERLLSEAPAP